MEQHKPNNLQEFWDMLNRHDWFYVYSDDGSVYRRGEAAQRALEGVANIGPEFKALYDAFHKYHFTGKPWGTEQAPKPARPEIGHDTLTQTKD